MPFKNIKIFLEFLKYTSKNLFLAKNKDLGGGAVIVFVFETGSYYESLAGLELREAHLPLPP